MRRSRVASPLAGVPLQSARLLQRQCACGNHAAGGECTDCENKRLQAKAIAIGAAHDPLEAEADRAAEAVMGRGSPRVGAGQSPRLSRAVMPAASPAPAPRGDTLAAGPDTAPPIVDRALAGGGQSLDAATRHFMESRFGHDFSGVRVHADALAAASAHAVGARAYTVGRDVVFGAGHYQPGSESGNGLIAHELAHVVQQRGGGVLRRAPDPKAVQDFDTRLAKLKVDATYTGLDAAAKKEIDDIADIVRKRDNVSYYIGKLELLFATPETSSGSQSAATAQQMKDAAAKEAKRLARPGEKAIKGKEEAVSKAREKKFKPAQGLGATFEIDATDPTDIAVRAKVQLVAKGSGTNVDVANAKALEDAMEKRASTLGYSVDLVFVDKPGADVFTVDVDTSQWTVSSNWVGDDIGLVHELHHLLGLAEDRYDYIESHAGNEDMKIPDRIHWFRAELSKAIANDPLSIMNSGENLPLDDDICMVAGNRTRVDIDACAQKRSAAREGRLKPGLDKARDRATKADAALAAKPKEALDVAQRVFGKTMAPAALAAPLKALPAHLAMGNLHLVSRLTAGCESGPTLLNATAPRIRLCPAFLDLGEEAQAQALLDEALHAAGIGSTTGEADCAKPGCAQPCGSDANAKAWARFVDCGARL